VTKVIETVDYADVKEGGCGERRQANDDFRLAWIWVEGWRGRLRVAGDVVEKER
jgi:hypothetical protein